MSNNLNVTTPTFLIVDDDPLIVHALARALRPLGKVSFTNAFDRVHVTAALAQPRFILIDIDLPDVTGLDIARTIRANPELKGADLILMTAHSADAVLKEGEALTGIPVFKKPINMERLLDFIKQRT
nr:response regulator [Hydrogenophaga intermedia]